ncbi:hypothetical protein C8T65DRAFT_567011 [Cerioporus squamosus]|nr:hypothetical protein C8T65DRAFT_567011 [Cerioporus squamosus]
MAEPNLTTGQLNIATAELIGLWLQLLATGAYLMYVPKCATVLRRDWKARSSPRWLPIACALIFVLTMSDVALGLARAYQAFHVKAGQLADPLTYYLDARTTLNITKDVINVVLPLILDTIIIFRTYVIWEMSMKMIAVPSCLVLSSTAFGALALAALPLGKIQASGLISTYTLQYYFITTFCLNVICSGLICWQIWRISAGVFRVSSCSDYPSGGSVMSRVLEVLIQSAAIYCAYILALILSSRTSVFFILVDPVCCPPIFAIVFSMLIVRARDTQLMSANNPSISRSLQFRRDRCTEVEQPVASTIQDMEMGHETQNTEQ